MNVEEELIPWVKCHHDIAKTLKKHEQKRQELIKGFNLQVFMHVRSNQHQV